MVEHDYPDARCKCSPFLVVADGEVLVIHRDRIGKALGLELYVIQWQAGVSVG